ncbi:nucleotidyltransferase family protein [Paraglaciecola arctica]|uniref:nucleotidyltransferase family protein n=1 Tax=Paraglaciecola arctica TaxID=1128911 RepID=UPI001C0706F4|nr:nucleotidyltransferase family protein [Paraglaciecola arctica]MBU3004342.1 nucleotidyltransferase family protein [Paraglaciecola arctica]
MDSNVKTECFCLLADMCNGITKAKSNFEYCHIDELTLFNLAVQHGVTALVKQNKAILESNRFIAFYQKVDAFNKHKTIATNFFDAEAAKLLRLLVQQGTPFVVLKGFALARTIYPNSNMRTKADIDLLISEKDVDKVKQIFKQQDYFNPRGWEPKVIINQFSQRKTLSEKLNVDFDIHLKISTNKRLENVLSLEQLLEHSVTDNETKAQFVGFAPALLHAIFHLMNHRARGDLIKLIWYYDIFLLCEKLYDQDPNEFLQLVNEVGLGKVTIKTLELTTEYFDSPAINNIIDTLESSQAAPEFDSLLTINSKSALLLESFSNQPSLKEKWLFLKETVFPPQAEIYAKYGVNNKQPLIWLYIRRIFNGLIETIHS